MTRKTKISITDDQLKTLKSPIYRTWSAINSDLPESTDNEQALECVFDADYMNSYGGPEAQEAHKIFTKLADDHGYLPALKALARHIKLV